jgi:hypothetical protein
MRTGVILTGLEKKRRFITAGKAIMGLTGRLAAIRTSLQLIRIISDFLPLRELQSGEQQEQKHSNNLQNQILIREKRNRSGRGFPCLLPWTHRNMISSELL